MMIPSGAHVLFVLLFLGFVLLLVGSHWRSS